MRVLLIGNVANNSYNLAKFLRRENIRADVLCFNSSYVMSQPEWEDADFEGEVIPSFPDWARVDLKGFKRPEWFKQELYIFPPWGFRKSRPLASDPKKTIFQMKNPGFLKRIIKQCLFAIHPFYHRSGLKKRISPKIKSRLKSLIYLDNLSQLKDQESEKYCFSEDPMNLPPASEMERILDMEKLIGEFKELFPRRKDQLTREDFSFYYKFLPRLRRTFLQYDLIHASGIDPIYALLAGGNIPYVAFEHGTLRDLPFEDSPQGRLLSLAYKKASRVIITNPDTLDSAKKLNLKNYLFIPHPLDQDKYRPSPSPLCERLRSTYGVRHILFSPARHDWDVKGNDLIIRGVAKYIKESKKSILLIFTLWGLDIKNSKKLIKKLSISKSVLWMPVLNEHKHLQYLNAADIILDQMLLPSFGGVTFKGMSCQKPVITSYRHEKNKWCLPEAPPIVTAHSGQELCDRIKELLDNPGLRDQIGTSGRDWILKHHSRQLVVDRMIHTYHDVLQERGKTEERKMRG